MIIYQTTDADGRCYQVRRAGQSIRLYTDGVFHTQYHPRRLQESSLWDLLWLPVLAKAEATITAQYMRILVLGVGGGAVMGKLRRLYPNALLVGVDLNPVHLRIARDFFGVTGASTLLLEADAEAFVHYYRGPAFDIIIDDLFTECEGEPLRAITFDNRWCQKLLSRLTPEGLLVGNFASLNTFKKSAPMQDFSAHFAERWLLRLRGYDNAIGAFYGSPSLGDTLQQYSGGKYAAAREIRRL